MKKLLMGLLLITNYVNAQTPGVHTPEILVECNDGEVLILRPFKGSRELHYLDTSVNGLAFSLEGENFYHDAPGGQPGMKHISLADKNIEFVIGIDYDKNKKITFSGIWAQDLNQSQLDKTFYNCSFKNYESLEKSLIEVEIDIVDTSKFEF